jgi:crossover junction endodeoxyribonuclease RusA
MPFPPSVNSIWRGGKNIKTGAPMHFKSKEYQAWEKLADSYAYLTPRVSFTGPVAVEYVFHRPDNRRRDVANLEKAVSDTLQRWQIVVDDCQIHHLTLRWAAPEEVSVGEVSVTVSEL